MDSRIGEHLNSGPGFEGVVSKKDISNLIYICNHYGLNEVAKYWEQVININSWQQERISRIIVDKLFGTISDKNLTIFGFAFKPNTNDTRESPSIKICKNLLEEGCTLSIYDPKVLNEQIEKDLDNFKDSWKKFDDLYEAASGSDAIIILTGWDEFFDLDYAKLYSVMRFPCWIFDTRNIINIKLAESFGFNIWKLGDGSF